MDSEDRPEPEDPERAKKIAFGPIYEVTEATYIVKAGSTIKNFADLDQPGVKVVAVNNTTTMRGAQAHLKNVKVTGYETYDEIFNLLNRANFNTPNLIVFTPAGLSGTAGAITSTSTTARQVQFGIKLLW